MGSVFRAALAFVAVAAMLCVEPRSVSAGFSIRSLFHHSSHDWTQFRLGPDNNAVVGGSLNVTWRVETGGQISASPTLADNVVYIGNNNGTLYAIDAPTGRTLWTFQARNPLMSAPLLVGDLVIVGE
ncbi:MAG: PQQ-binding-like beta-propeller repeat protein, partial [Candidatus Eremiobacteraeota bacterium]|nr:PQQ-binding-like beta-propeller repeat protein [Candidatus Eremiobacteraeota bacterium]